MDWKTGARFPKRPVYFIVSKTTRTLVGFTHLNVQLEAALLSLGIKRQKRETRHSIWCPGYECSERYFHSAISLYMAVLTMRKEAFISILLPFQEVDKINADMYFSSVIISARQFAVNCGLVVKVKAVSLHVNRHG
jgi:hypothetical protein